MNPSLFIIITPHRKNSLFNIVFLSKFAKNLPGRRVSHLTRHPVNPPDPPSRQNQ